MSSNTLSQFVSPKLTKRSSTNSEVTLPPAKTGTKPGAVHSASFSRASSNLAEQHQDFDKLALELESDTNLAQELADAGAWVADRFYAGEAETLKTMRLRKGYSQTQLAKLIGTSQPHVANLERSQGDVMFSTAEKICEALEISMDVFQMMLKRQREINASRGRK